MIDPLKRASIPASLTKLANLLTPTLLACIVLLLATLGFFGQVFLSEEPVVLSHSSTDISLQFVYWRDFGFKQLAQGNLALWNPYIFGGTPYFGGFQAALLYPPNWFYLILPLPTAINFGIVLHIFLAGLFMYFWTSGRGLQPVACLTSSLLFMFCGAHFLHVYAGHLTNLCVIAWIPLLFFAVDGYFKKLSTSWILLGILGVCMQVLAGHPQYVFFTGVAVGIYSVLQLRRPFFWRRLMGLAAMYGGGAALSAVQLITGLQATSEGIRARGLSYSMASMFSFPPENFLTLLVPGFFGNLTDFPYWGRWYLWEVSLFLGVSGLVLAIYGALYGERRVRCFSVTMIILLMILAIGAYSPMFKFLYHWVPGFNLFRSTCKFIVLTSIFTLMLSAIGIDALTRNTNRLGHFSRILAAVALVMSGIGLSTYWLTMKDGVNLWEGFLQRIVSTREVYFPLAAYHDPEFVNEAGVFAAKGVLICCATLLLLALLFSLIKSVPQVVYLIAAMAIVEILIFAKTTQASFDINAARFPEIENFLKSQPGDYRVLFPEVPDMTMSLEARNLWGYDPGVLKRYAEFMTFSQGLDPDDASQYLQFKQYHPFYEMLRCRFLFVADGTRTQVRRISETLPRLQLTQDWVVLSDRDRILTTMESPTFNPRKTVILESPPVPAPIKTDLRGEAEVVESSTDHLTIEANLPASSILLITDNYSSGWQAVALPGSAQQEYSVLPANYTFRAIPLSAGRHRLRMEYLPRGFLVGKWISIVSLAAYVLALAWHLSPRFRRNGKLSKGTGGLGKGAADREESETHRL